MKANIFDIQKASHRDGPGLRTVVFFKGCSMRCTWCADLTSPGKPINILWDRKKCFYGHLCSIHCPTGSLFFDHDILHFERESCTGCRDCISQCPSKALEFEEKLLNIDEVMEMILEDEDDLKTSGGVTLTGGEVLSQPDFAIELLKKCKERGIHTAIETSGYVSPLVFSRTARHADLILFQIKHYDSKEHVKYTGVPQGKIIENLDTSISMKFPTIARIPVVPGVNGSLSDAKRFALFLKEHRIDRVELLSYIQTTPKEYTPLYQENNIALGSDLMEYAAFLVQAGLQVSVI